MRFTNQGTLGAVNALTLNAANVDNQAGADLNSASTSVNAANAITNEGRIEVATQTLTNSRPAPTVDTMTTDVSSLHQIKRGKYIACTPSNGYGNAGCGDSVWSGPDKTPLTTTYAAPDVVSETSGANATDRALVVSVNGVQQTIWYNTATTNPDGSVKQIADYVDQDSTTAGESARAALHAIVGCAGAAASSQSCGAGAMGAATSSLLGTLLAPTDGMSAEDRLARENLVTSLVGGIATTSGTNAATSTNAGQMIEAENNQLAVPMASPPVWLAGFKLPGFTGQSRGKGDGIIADPATELLDPSMKGGPLISPMPDAKSVNDWITAIIPDQVKNLVDYVFTMAGGDGGNSAF